MLVTLAGWGLAAAELTATLWLCLGRRRDASALARACHEVRGPLGSLGLVLEAGRRAGGLGPARIDALELQLQRAAGALSDLERLREWPGTRGELRLEELEIAAIIEAVAAALESHAAASGGRLSVRGGPPRVRVLVDRRRLAQALTNLVLNAIEHGGGEVELSWRCEPARVRIEVSDQGPGLPAPVDELVAAARRRRTRRGLGLAIAAENVHAHGGRLATAPAVRGARVVVELAARSGPPVSMPLARSSDAEK